MTTTISSKWMRQIWRIAFKVFLIYFPHKNGTDGHRPTKHNPSGHIHRWRGGRETHYVPLFWVHHSPLKKAAKCACKLQNILCLIGPLQLWRKRAGRAGRLLIVMLVVRFLAPPAFWCVLGARYWTPNGPSIGVWVFVWMVIPPDKQLASCMATVYDYMCVWFWFPARHKRSLKSCENRWMK